MADLAVTVEAAETWCRYRARGRRRIRIASNFLIAAHALSAADRLLTRDRGFYRRHFAKLRAPDSSF